MWNSLYQLTNFRMLKFSFDVLDLNYRQKIFELIQMDPDSLYFSLSNGNYVIIKSNVKDECLKDKTIQFVHKFDKRSQLKEKLDEKG